MKNQLVNKIKRAVAIGIGLVSLFGVACMDNGVSKNPNGQNVPTYDWMTGTWKEGYKLENPTSQNVPTYDWMTGTWKEGYKL